MTRLRSNELPKLYYPTPDELQGATPLVEGFWANQNNHGTWFDIYQELLVRLANTDYGRDLLCIDKHPYPVISMRKNMTQFDMSQDLGPGCTLSDVRIGAKWGNVIRYRWSHAKKALDQMNLEILLSLPEYIIHEGRGIPLMRGAATTTFYPDPHTETSSCDGWARRLNTAGEDWSVIRTGSGTQGFANSTDNEGVLDSDTNTNKWDNISRDYYLFDTSAIGPDTIDSATLSLVTTTIGDARGNDYSAIVNTTPSSNTDIASADYGQSGTTLMANTIKLSDITEGGSTYTDFALITAGINAVAGDGVTKLGGRIEADRADAEPTWGSNQSANTRWRAADTSGTSTDPKLVVAHTAVFVPRVIMF